MDPTDKRLSHFSSQCGGEFRIRTRSRLLQNTEEFKFGLRFKFKFKFGFRFGFGFGFGSHTASLRANALVTILAPW